MKIRITKTILVVLCLAAVQFATAQALFNVGSTGTFGPLNVTNDLTLPMPPDGVFHCTTINVAPGTTLRFTRNTLNTPVTLLATGDVVIAGTINVGGGASTTTTSGVGGPGGFDGGKPGFQGQAAGDGYGPGAGKASVGNCDAPGSASHATVGFGPAPGTAYGTPLLMPLTGGSGGGGFVGAGGGGGAGAILIGSNTRITVSGTIDSTGGSGTGCYNGGSGGAIRLLAPAVAGSGLLNCNGGGGAGQGRIRIDTVDTTGVNFNRAGVWTLGSQMAAFPPVTPRLDIIEAAGTVIPVGSGPVVINLPFASTTNRTVKVRAQDFSAVVPIYVVVTPDTGPSVKLQAQIDNLAANPAQTTVDVVIPVNTRTTINAWVR